MNKNQATKEYAQQVSEASISSIKLCWQLNFIINYFI